MIQGFITVAQLREEIGRPTLDTADPGYIPDTALSAIIERHREEALKEAERMASAATERGLAPGPRELFEPIVVSLSASTLHPSIHEGTIPSSFHPWCLSAVDQHGRQLHYDEDIVKTANTSFVIRRVYKVVGNLVYVFSQTPTSVVLKVAPKEKLYDHLISGEIINRFNRAIVETASRYMERVTREGIRLEQIFLPNDGVIGNAA